MKIRFILVGKPHASYFEKGYEEYRKRLLKYADSVEIVYVKETKLSDKPNEKEIEKALDKEAMDIQKNLQKNSCIVTLDIHGKEYDSYSFSSLIGNIKEKFTSIDFIIGSSYGLSNKVRNFSHYLVKLSPLTFTHPLTLLIVEEQVYRAFKILSNETYQK